MLVNQYYQQRSAFYLVASRSSFWTLSNMYNNTFCEKSFNEKIFLSKLFDRDLNRTLTFERFFVLYRNLELKV